MTRHITENERAEIVRLALAGELSRKGIARAVKRHEDTVADVMRREGIIAWPTKAQAADWTPERVEILRAMHKEGATYTMIAARLGCTRNKVIGKGQRLGLVGQRTVSGGMRVHHAKRNPSRGRKYGNGGGIGFKIANGTFGKNAKARAQPAPRQEPPKPPTCDPVTLIDRTWRQCCFPLGNPKGPDTLMCGATVSSSPADRPYCRWHAKISFNPPAQRNIENIARVV